MAYRLEIISEINLNLVDSCWLLIQWKTVPYNHQVATAEGQRAAVLFISELLGGKISPPKFSNVISNTGLEYN